MSILGSGKAREAGPVYRQAMRLGRAVAQKGFSVCHGGYAGVMEAVAKGCRSANGPNIAVTIQRSSSRANPWADVEIQMPSWRERLFKLIEIGDAYIFLDGATGTLNELFFILEMTNRGLLEKPILLLGKRLHKLIKFMKKDTSLQIPAKLYLASSIPETMKILSRSRAKR